VFKNLITSASADRAGGMMDNFIAIGARPLSQQLARQDSVYSSM